MIQAQEIKQNFANSIDQSGVKPPDHLQLMLINQMREQSDHSQTQFQRGNHKPHLCNLNKDKENIAKPRRLMSSGGLPKKKSNRLQASKRYATSQN